MKQRSIKKVSAAIHREDQIKMKNIADEYEKIVIWSDEDKCFIGFCPELFSGGVHGDDPLEVFKELLQVVDEWVEIFKKDGRSLPEPRRSVLQAA